MWMVNVDGLPLIKRGGSLEVVIPPHSRSPRDRSPFGPLTPDKYSD
jgi:hypothetical protein